MQYTQNYAGFLLALSIAASMTLVTTQAYAATEADTTVAQPDVVIDQIVVVVADDKSRTSKKVIKGPDIITPTGKFNIYNTSNDIY